MGGAYAVAAFLVVRNGDPQRGAAETRATPGMSRDTTAWPGDGATGTAGGARGRVERECPWCAEPILAKARACKHCLRQVEPLVHPEA